MRWLAAIGLLAALAAGCLNRSDEPDRLVATATSRAVTPVSTPEAAIPPGPSELVPPPQSPQVLIVWTAPEICPRSDLPGGDLLTEQFSAYDSSRSNLRLEVHCKTAVGPGGTLAYLRTGRDIAPDILPDLILLPAGQLVPATEAQLILPLDGLVPAEMRADLYPAAQVMGQVDDAFMGFPYALTGLGHLALNNNVITQTLPADWDNLIRSSARFAFPAAGDSGAFLALQFYLEAGGALSNEAGQPILQLEPLSEALTRINAGRESGFILFQSTNARNLEEAWSIFQNGTASLVLTSVDVYLGRRLTGDVSGVGPVPGPNGPFAPFVNGWVWAVSTPDAARQQLALALLTALTAPEELGAWSLQSNALPARRSALATWSADDPYVSFLAAQLELAQALPEEATGSLLEAMRNAVFDVVSLAQSPRAAAQAAVSAVRP